MGVRPSPLGTLTGPRRRRVVAVGIAVLVAAVLAGVVARHEYDSPGARIARFCSTLRSPSGRGATEAVTAGRPTVVVLGDSYSSGFALEHPREAWPTWLGRQEHWQVYVDGVAGTGMVAGAFCSQPYGGRVAQVLSHAPARVVVQVGLNDTGVPAARERRAAAAVLAALRGVAEVDVIGPPPVPGKRAVELRAVDTTLASACRDEHRRYVSALHWTLHYLPDGVHLTPAGHVRFAALVAAAIR